MKKTLLVAVVAASIGACAGRGRIAEPPTLFPIATAWTAPLADLIDGPLATDGVRIFVATRAGVVLALDATTGGTVWQRDGHPGRLGAGKGVLVVRQADGSVSAIDPETGATRWKAATGVGGTLPPAVGADGILVAGDGIASLKPKSGRLLWSEAGAPSVTAPPVFWGPWVLAGEADGTLRCRDAATGVSLWTHRTASAIVAPPVVDDRGRLLLGTTDRRFLALDVNRKGKRRWRWKVGADIQTQAAVLGDTVLFATYEDVLYALKRANGHLVWRAALPSRPLSGPILVGSAVLVACHEDDIVGFDGRSGKRLGGLKTPAAMRTPPIVIGDRLYVGLRNRSVVALQLGAPPETPASPTASPAPPQ